MFQAASETSACLKAPQDGSDGSDWPFRFRHETNIYQYYHQNPLKGARFARAMAGVEEFRTLLHDADERYEVSTGACFRWMICKLLIC